VRTPGVLVPPSPAPSASPPDEARSGHAGLLAACRHRSRGRQAVALLFISIAIMFSADIKPAQAFCRCECQIQIIPYGRGFLRRRICRRICWPDAPPVRYTSPPVWASTPPYRQPQIASSPPTYEHRRYEPPASDPPFQFPPVPPALLAVIGLLFVAVLIGRLATHLSGISLHRRVDEVERETDSARAMKERVEQTANDADDIIRRYAEEAYRRGRDA